jgi:tetratricopeptide (TPR) repeat protein
MRRTFIIAGLLVLSLSLFAQTETEKQQAYDKAKNAIQLMDDGKYDESIEILKESGKLDPDNYLYPYEIGYALLLKKEYKKASKYFEKVVKMDGINAQCYQMLGNSYSIGGKKEKALDAYQRGLEIYPNSGRLYLEIGNLYQEDLNKALEYYEKGVEVDPEFASNYYWLAKIFCNSDNEMWGMLYGEIFMNIERGSKRTEEISKLLFDTYKSEIKISSDSTMSVSFCKDHIMGNEPGAIPLSMVYEPGLAFAAVNAKSITLESLNSIRKEFIDFYNDKKFNESHPNIIFEWHNKLINDNYFDCYNYWLMMQGSPEEFGAWYSSNENRFREFIKWFSDNPLLINKDNKFHRFNN